jgi:hypothetical protein
MTFTAGETVLRRYFKGDQLTFMNVLRVVSDDDRGLRLWLPAGSPYWRRTDAAGRTLHDAPIDELVDSRLAELSWQGNALIWMPPDSSYSVWSFFDPDFEGWYVNLEDPYVVWRDADGAGVDTVDHALDVWVEPDRTWRWKDMDEFEARTGLPLYWSAAEAAEILARGERLIALAEAGTHPFDGTDTDFVPDPQWPVPSPGLPAAWDRPRARP